MTWLISKALMNSPSLLERGGEFLEAIYSDGEQSVPLNGSPTQQAYCAPDKMTAFSRLSRFGMTFKPLTEIHGEELLMSYRAGFRAKTLVPKEKASALKVSAQECGHRWQGLLAKYDPSTHLLKTVQGSLFEDLNESLQTWPRWGSMRNGECFLQPMWALNMKEKEFGSWATPTACDWKGTHHATNYSVRKAQYLNLTGGTVTGTIYPNPITYEVLMGWPQGWTDLKPLATGKCHFAPQPHLTH